MRVEYTPSPTEVNVKRFYLPCSVFDFCTECGVERETELDSCYLSHPVLHTPEVVHMYCAACENEWDVEVVLELSVRAATEND